MNPTKQADRRTWTDARTSGTRRGAGVLGLALVLSCLALGVPSAMAQGDSAAPKALAPPTPPAPKADDALIVPMLIAVILGGLVLGTGFIPSKRGHQD